MRELKVLCNSHVASIFTGSEIIANITWAIVSAFVRDDPRFLLRKMAKSTEPTGRRRGRPRLYDSSWEDWHVRVWISKELYQSWVDLKRTGGFANDDDFVYHLLRAERDRQDCLDPE